MNKHESSVSTIKGPSQNYESLKFSELILMAPSGLYFNLNVSLAIFILGYNFRRCLILVVTNLVDIYFDFDLTYKYKYDLLNIDACLFLFY